MQNHVFYLHTLNAILNRYEKNSVHITYNSSFVIFLQTLNCKRTHAKPTQQKLKYLLR
jgi:hypothetical protein